MGGRLHAGFRNQTDFKRNFQFFFSNRTSRRTIQKEMGSVMFEFFSVCSANCNLGFCYQKIDKPLPKLILLSPIDVLILFIDFSLLRNCLYRYFTSEVSSLSAGLS